MIRRCIIGMVAWMLIGEVHSLLPAEAMAQDASDWFPYANLPAGYITAGWWLYEVEGMVKYMLAAIMVVTLARRVSSKLTYAAYVLVAHSVFVLIMFVGFYKKPAWLFLVEAAIVLSVLRTFLLKEKIQATVIRMK